MPRRSWAVSLVAVGVAFALAAIVFSSQEIASMYNAAHPDALAQFAPPGVHIIPNPGLQAARNAWDRLPWVVLLWLVTAACVVGVLVLRGHPSEPGPTASPLSQ